MLVQVSSRRGDTVLGPSASDARDQVQFLLGLNRGIPIARNFNAQWLPTIMGIFEREMCVGVAILVLQLRSASRRLPGDEDSRPNFLLPKRQSHLLINSKEERDSLAAHHQPFDRLNAFRGLELFPRLRPSSKADSIPSCARVLLLIKGFLQLFAVLPVELVGRAKLQYNGKRKGILESQLRLDGQSVEPPDQLFRGGNVHRLHPGKEP
mmetsp:Transcript_69756/g.160317  ORF Transcript_69756/g.160317 Transcript_69756/m.160317 type:complete len:209 (-) Transcript_69756:241-867(-)